MGNIQANLNMFDPAHVRIYTNLLQIQNPKTRVGMIQTLLAGPEYIQSARQAGVYSHMLAYVARVNSGERPAPLPGEVQMQGTQRQQQQPQQSTQITAHRAPSSAPTSPSSYVTKGRGNEKAMNYFQNCLLVLDLEEEVALTESALRTAYKKAAVKAHPDKGGSEQEFEAVTRAYAYLTEILRRIQGGRTKESVVEAPNVLKDSRVTESKDWDMLKPVKLNPKKLDMNAFNTMFEQTRIPDPDDTGYGDWLKGADASKQAGPNFGGKFNRDVFNKAFEDEARKTAASSALSVLSPEAMILAPGHGVELGRTNSGSYTAPANASMKYTDLKQAYTTDNTFSNQVSGVQVDARSYDTVAAQRKRAPDPLTNTEMEGIQAAERQQVLREEQRKVRAAQEMVQADEYFKRMKQLVLMEGPQSARKNQR